MGLNADTCPLSPSSEIYRSIRFDQSNDQSSEGGMDMDGRKEEGRRRIWRLPSCHWTLQCTTSIDKLSLGLESDISKCSATILKYSKCSATILKHTAAEHLCQPSSQPGENCFDRLCSAVRTDRQRGRTLNTQLRGHPYMTSALRVEGGLAQKKM